MIYKIVLGHSFFILNDIFAQPETKPDSLSARNKGSHGLAEEAYIRHRDFSLIYWQVIYKHV